MEQKRCPWCLNNEKMFQYHDKEWGVPLHDDYKQFEFLMMEVMQCGLNWNMMIQKREIFKGCFDGFDYDKVAAYDEHTIECILNTEGMIRSRRKVEAVIHNAKCFQAIRNEFETFSQYIWSFSAGKTILFMGHHHQETRQSISFDNQKRGFGTSAGIRQLTRNIFHIKRHVRAEIFSIRECLNLVFPRVAIVSKIKFCLSQTVWSL